MLAIPDSVDVFLGGGRGGGKTFALLLLVLRFVEEYGGSARALFIRPTYLGAEDFVTTCRLAFGEVYGDAARYNGNERVWRFPGGGTLEIGQLQDVSDWRKYQGRSFGLIVIDEAGQWPTLETLELLRSCLRAPKVVPVRMVLAANPADVGHAGLARRFVLGRSPWVPFVDERSARLWVFAPSTFGDNPHVDAASYRRMLQASTSDPELLRAWVEGDWTVAKGAYFASVLDEPRVAVEWPDHFVPPGWTAYLAHDFGVSAPSITYVCLESQGALGGDGRFYPPRSVVLADELATCEPGSLSRGMGYTVPRLADEIKELARLWRIEPDGVADDACFARTGGAAGSIASEFAAHGVSFSPARKSDRRTGWEVMRRMLADAGKPDRPGLHVDRRCAYWWQTVPTLPRDPRRVDDVDTRAPDHGADACRYALGRERTTWTVEEIVL